MGKTKQVQPMTEEKTQPIVAFPETDNFFINTSGIRIHFRHYLPENIVQSKVRGIIFFLHGYAAHGNRIKYADFAKRLNDEGFVVVLPDHQGHGYSGPPEQRVVVHDAQSLVADVVQLVRLFLGLECMSTRANLALPTGAAEVLKKCPFFIGGQSMGGGLALATGLTICRGGDNQQLKDQFQGVMLHCPLICMKLPPLPVKWLLKYLIAPVMRTRSMPAFLDATSDPNDIWTSQEIIDMVQADPLGFHQSIRFCTAVALVNLAESLQKDVSSIDFPFVTIHDPEDKVVTSEGSELLMSSSSTPESLKEYHMLNGQRHDLVMNCSDVTAPILAAFGKKVIAANSKL